MLPPKDYLTRSNRFVCAYIFSNAPSLSFNSKLRASMIAAQ
jgi:hypothetical protein